MSPILPDARIPRVRDRIEIEVPAKGPHPAVVLCVEPGMMILAVGSTTPIDDPEIIAVDRPPHLTTMRLRPGDRTVFYERWVQPASWNGEKFRIWAKCPPFIFDVLFRAMERISREAETGSRRIWTIPPNQPQLMARMVSSVRPKAVLDTGPLPAVSAALAEADETVQLSERVADKEPETKG